MKKAYADPVVEIEKFAEKEVVETASGGLEYGNGEYPIDDETGTGDTAIQSCEF
jgi:hypothetical protein